MRGLAALMATVTLFQFHAARGAPGDIFSIPAPTIGADPPKASELRDGDASVSTQTGSFNYSYPITVPPGRNGMVPHLALSYSSQAPIYGGVAAGWSLSIPEIREDTSGGRLRTHSPEVEGTQGIQALVDDKFESSLAGGRPLVLVTEPWGLSPGVFKQYRAQNDTTFARYERMLLGHPFRWRVYTSDGITHFFGEVGKVQGCAISEKFAPLTLSVDSFGNAVSYHYAMSSGECMIKSVVYGSGSADLQPFAKVEIVSSRAPQCSGIEVGSKRDYRAAGETGTPHITGANKISSIVITAHTPGNANSVVHTRSINLGYLATAESCERKHGAVRLLASIQETASGIDSPAVTLPPVTFTYGAPDADLTQFVTLPGTAPWQPVGGGPADNLGWGIRHTDDRWPTVEAMMLDVDGDGLLDRVTNISDTANGATTCRALWQRNRPGLNFDQQRPLTFGSLTNDRMPMLRWRGGPANDPNGSPQANPGPPDFEGCALNGQVTAFKNSHSNPGLCHDNQTVCSPDTYCPDGNVCPDGAIASPRTYLAYRWLDMDGDGLTDLVTAVHGNSSVYDIIRGNDIVNGQQVGFEPPLFGTVPVPGGFPSCPGADSFCRKLGSSCMSPFETCREGELCTRDWGGINQCTSNSDIIDCELEVGVQVATQAGFAPPVNPSPGNTGTPGNHKPQRWPYKMCNNLYPWFIFKNRGNGNFSDTPVIKYQPIPLESDTGDSALIGPTLAAQDQGFFDIDGDGLLDGVGVGRDGSGNSGAWWWHVWLNDGSGGMGPKRYTWPSVSDPHNEISGIGGIGAGSSKGSTTGLLDINGDGLPDHWSALPHNQPTATVAFNGGTGFRVFGPSSFKRGELLTATTRPGSDSAERCNGQPCPASGLYPATVEGFGFLRSGVRFARKRTADLDSDGRVDVVRKDQFSSTPIATFNQGGQFAAVNHGFDVPGASQEAHAHENGVLGGVLTWQSKTDFIDLDGDGVPESTSWAAAGMLRHVRPPALGPPRLMLTINNGRGATTTVDYASMNTTGVVEQHPEQFWEPGRPKASPHTQWVVQSLSVNDTIANTTSDTRYRYINPRHGADDEGSYSFRGFEEIVTISPSLSETVQRYTYDPDWSGRLAETIVRPRTGALEVHTIDRTSWEERTLFGVVKTYHPIVSEHFVCSTGQLEASCRAGAAGYTRTTSTLTPLSSDVTGGVPILWQQTGSLLQTNALAADGDRETSSTFAVHAERHGYRVRPLVTTKRHRVAGAMTTYAQSAQTWDSFYLAPLTEEIWFDDKDENRAITRFAYDLTTGNLVARWKPVQHDANGQWTSFTYDARKLFAISEVNELGHRTDSTHEYGTGATLTTEGPNARTCTSSCPSGPTFPVKELHKIRVDGLGRTLERWDTISDDGAVYTLTQMETNSYVDALSGTTPPSITNRVRMDATPSSVWKQERVELDGHNRPVRKILATQGSAPADHITTFQYGNDGNVVTVTLPDPTVNSSAVVTYSYGYDTLGRPTMLRRPDFTERHLQSGVDITYDGLLQTTTEFVGGDGGEPASSTGLSDSFGRLIQVRELTQTSPPTFAITQYNYGPDDLMAAIVDPEGVTTSLEHDLAGRRTRITRSGGRVWAYTYDRNGNMTSERVPGSQSPVTDLDYTSFTIYDDLDRPISKIVAPRDLSSADRTLFASNTESFTWDTGANGKGFLRSWQAFGPGSSTPALSVDVSNNSQGQRTLTSQTLQLAGYPTLTRQLRQNYFLFGGVRTTDYGDQIGGANATSSEVTYDPRFQPSSMRLLRTGEPTQVLAEQTRNIAGFVTKRRTNTTGPMTFIESNFTYDKLSRVTSQVVQKGPGPATVARQAIAYFGNDDPRVLTHQLGSTSRDFSFIYDARHQLLKASTADPSYFTGSYVYSHGGRFDRLTHARSVAPPPGSELKPRDVRYLYGGVDPEQVTALIDNVKNTPFATYTYDLAGNQLTRTYLESGESWTFTYDGFDQLRRATKTQGGTLIGTEEYWYDNNGQRVGVVKRDSSGASTELIQFLADLQAHYNGSGTPTHLYSHLSLGTPVARVDRTSNTSTSLEYQFHGLANHTLAAVASNGTINASFTYAPYGEVLEATNAGDPDGSAHRRRFNDKFEDSLTKLSYYGFRYYDQIAVNWTQSDPLFRFAPDASYDQPRRAALYTFTLSNPLSYIDPDGRNPQQMFSARARALGEALDGAKKKAVATVKQATIVTLTVLENAPIPGPWGVIVRVGATVARALLEGDDGPVDAASVGHPGGSGGGGRAGGGGGGGGSVPKPKGSSSKEKPGVVYKVDGSNTPSGKPYVGRTTSPDGPAGRGKSDGRDRSGAEVTDTYGSRAEGRRKEQQSIDANGGVGQLDNKRNEIAGDKRAENGLSTDPNVPTPIEPKDPRIR